jgi:hypothetical protein
MSPFLPPLDVLLADGPDPELVDELRLFGQLVGSWDLEVVYHDEGGRRKLSAEWHFTWALNGRAVLDVWIAPSRRDRERGEPPVEWGTSLRFYDPRIDAWRSTWVGPTKGLVLPFLARPAGDEIVLEGRHDDVTLTRWIFSAITPSSFSWRAVESDDGGTTWALRQEMWARRA